MIAKTYGCTILGLKTSRVEVEAGIYGGLPEFLLVGLPDASVRESRERVRAAILSAGFRWPARRTIVNLAPADLRKEGGGLDLAVAAGLLAATGQLPQELALEDYIFIGELSLDGSVRATKGVLSAALSLGQDSRKRFLVVPAENYAEASCGSDRVIPLERLEQLSRLPWRKTAVLRKEGFFLKLPREPEEEKTAASAEKTADLRMVRGQLQARRALELAACGGLSLLLIGPPGCGKSLLARCLPSILPPLEEEEALLVNRIYSSAGFLTASRPWISRRPFRSPHCTVTRAGLLGGGQPFFPGEISLAQHGVLYLDELPELDRNVLEGLRQPLEEGRITLRRAWGTVTMPASFQLVASANPCPCGFYGDGRVECRCSEYQLRRYRARLSGPLLDRMDMIVRLPRLGPELYERGDVPESSAPVAARVLKAREFGKSLKLQIPWSLEALQKQLSPSASRLAAAAYEERRMTARGYYRLLKLSRTVGDLAGEEIIREEHLAEALHFRQDI